MEDYYKILEDAAEKVGGVIDSDKRRYVSEWTTMVSQQDMMTVTFPKINNTGIPLTRSQITNKSAEDIADLLLKEVYKDIAYLNISK